MKTQKQNKMALKKLTIASINTNALNKIKGGSSIPPTEDTFQATVRNLGGPCVHIP